MKTTKKGIVDKKNAKGDKRKKYKKCKRPKEICHSVCFASKHTPSKTTREEEEKGKSKNYSKCLMKVKL